MTNYYLMEGCCKETLKTLPDKLANCCVTSPPYFGLRDYGHAGQIGLEKTPDEYVGELVSVFREVKRVLRDDGTLWLNLGDSYAGAGYSNHANTGGAQRSDGGKQKHLTGTGVKPKDLIGIPWRVAFALQADGWYLRQDIIWAKPNPMPESVTDRCTKSHEYIFLLSKGPRYYFDHEAVKEPAVNAGKRVSLGPKSFSKGQAAGAGISASGNGLADYYDVKETRNRRSVWTVTTKPFKGAHFATFPPELIRPCILAGSPQGGIVLDPFGGSGTTGMVALQEGRKAVLCELNPEYAAMIHSRCSPLDTCPSSKSLLPHRKTPYRRRSSNNACSTPAPFPNFSCFTTSRTRESAPWPKRCG